MPALAHSARRGRPARSHVALRPVLGAAVLALALAGCGGSRSEGSSPASDAGTSSPSAASPSSASTTAPAGSESAAPAAAPIAVTPPAEPVQLANACTFEGAHRFAVGAGADPALPGAEPGAPVLTLRSIDAGGDAPRAVFSATLPDGSVAPVEPAAVGDTFVVGPWMMSVTSVCDDAVEADVIG